MRIYVRLPASSQCSIVTERVITRQRLHNSRHGLPLYSTPFSEIPSETAVYIPLSESRDSIDLIHSDRRSTTHPRPTCSSFRRSWSPWPLSWPLTPPLSQTLVSLMRTCQAAGYCVIMQLLIWFVAETTEIADCPTLDDCF